MHDVVHVHIADCTIFLLVKYIVKFSTFTALIHTLSAQIHKISSVGIDVCVFQNLRKFEVSIHV